MAWDGAPTVRNLVITSPATSYTLISVCSDPARAYNVASSSCASVLGDVARSLAVKPVPSRVSMSDGEVMIYYKKNVGWGGVPVQGEADPGQLRFLCLNEEPGRVFQ